MSELVGHASFIRPIVIEVEGIHVEGVVTQMLPYCVEVALVAPCEGLYVQSVFDPVVDGSRRGGIARLRDETLPQRMLLELWQVAELFDERFEGLRLSFLGLEEPGGLTAFGELVWRRIALALNRRGPTWTT